MKKKLRNKKCCSLVLILVLIISFCTPVSASEMRRTSSDSESVMVALPDGRNSVTVTEEDLLITEEIAAYIAELFIKDMVETGTTEWDSNTAIINAVAMYDEAGENLTGYTMELTSGYVVVAAYADMPNMILEWSDEAEPVYKTFNTQIATTRDETGAHNKVVYLGVLDYFV